MARVTVKELQEKIEGLTDVIKQLRIVADGFDKENKKLHAELEQTRKNKGVVSQKEFDFLLKNYENEQMQVKEYKRLYEREKRLRGEERNELLKRLETSEKERAIIKTETVHNARNAGRKPFSDDVIIEKIKEMHTQGYSLQKIADTLNGEKKKGKKWAKSTVRLILLKNTEGTK